MIQATVDLLILLILLWIIMRSNSLRLMAVSILILRRCLPINFAREVIAVTHSDSRKDKFILMEIRIEKRSFQKSYLLNVVMITGERLRNYRALTALDVMMHNGCFGAMTDVISLFFSLRWRHQWIRTGRCFTHSSVAAHFYNYYWMLCCSFQRPHAGGLAVGQRVSHHLHEFGHM